MRIARIVQLVACGVAVLGCDDEATSSGPSTWTVATSPTVTIGALEGDPSYLFERIVGASFLSDGSIVVADAGLSVLRVFDERGAFLRQMGGDGEGPGEFRRLRDIWVGAADTITVWDSGALRLTRFSAGGALVGTVSLTPSIQAAGVGSLDLAVGPLVGGSVALGSLAFGSPDGTGRDRVSVEVFGPDGGHVGRMAEATGFLRVRFDDEVTVPAPFSPVPYFATHGSSVYFTNGEAPEVSVWSGDSTRVIGFPPASHDVPDAWMQLEKGLEAEGFEMFRDLLPQVPRSNGIPHLAGLLVDNGGRVWTKRYSPGTDALWLGGGQRPSGGVWWVADPTGELLAEVQMPAGLAPLDISGELVLGVTVDDLGIERVQVHRLAKQSR